MRQDKRITTAGLTDKFRPPTTKVCRICKNEKPIKLFSKCAKGRHGYANECLCCKKEHKDKKRADKAEYSKNYFTF